MVDFLIAPIFSFSGSCRITFDDGFSLKANFHVEMLKNSKIVGDLSFLSYHSNLLQHQKQLGHFTLRGRNSKDDRDITAQQCRLTNLVEETIPTRWLVSGDFTAEKLILSSKLLKTKPKRDLFIHFGLLNVYPTLRVSVETRLGILLLRHYKYKIDGNKDNEGNIVSEELMNPYRLSFISSFVQLSIQANGSQTLQQIVDAAKDIVQDFLKVTSLSQLTWHDWAFLAVYEKQDNSNSNPPTFLLFDPPIAKISSLCRIAPLGYTNDFINAAWKGYSKKLDEKYGFNAALEWLIESNSSNLYETRFLNASTCLEILMDRFHSQNHTEFLFNNDAFEEFYQHIKRYSRKLLNAKGVNTTTRSAVYRSLRGVNRRSYLDKAGMLLEYWGISYSDTGIALEDIVRIRDEITHQGKYYMKMENDISGLTKVYNGLMTILTRVLLAMLGYNKQYQDPWIDKWIKFGDVCNKIGSPKPYSKINPSGYANLQKR